MLLFDRPNRQMHRIGPRLWRAEGDDPQLLLHRMPGGPTFVVAEFERVDGSLAPSVYLNGGGGYSEDSRLDLGEAAGALIVVNLTDPATLGGVRIDPTDMEGSVFRLRLWRCRTRGGLRRLLRARMAARPTFAPALIGADPGLGAAGLGLRMPRLGRAGLADRLDGIWAMAGFTKLRDPLPRTAEPAISFVVPVFDTDTAFLDALLASFAAQGEGAELILSDDGSTSPATVAWLAAHADHPGVTVLRTADNRGIAAATNAGLAAARGSWIGLVDHDDALAPHIVDQLRRALMTTPETLFLYTDEVIADAALRLTGIFHKPGFDPVLLSGMNYVNHLSLYRRDRLLALGGLREGFHGSQDYELVLRYCRGLPADRILHLPYPGYVWRQRAESVSHAQIDTATAAARRALTEHFGAAARGAAAEAAVLLPHLHRIRLPRSGVASISAVIPNRDSPELLGRLLDDLETRTARRPDETIIVDNGTTDPRTLALYDARQDRRDVQVEIRPEPFNFARMVNRGVALARGDAILLLNNDISVLDPDWLGEMAECLAYPGTGIVGARLLYPDRSIQHAGVILGLGGLAGHWHYKARETEAGPMGRLAVRNSMTVVTAACMLVTRACWDAVGGMDEAHFAVAYNDVDFCARARAEGFGVVWTPFATLMHHESATRGADLMGEKLERFRREKAALAARHGTATFDDPCFSPWWSRWQSRPRPTTRGELAAGRHFHGMDGWPGWTAGPQPGGQAMR